MVRIEGVVGAVAGAGRADAAARGVHRDAPGRGRGDEAQAGGAAKVKIAVGTMLLVVPGAFIAMPYWTSFRIMEAARAGDAGRLSDHVNFPVLRENLSDQINALLVNATGEVGEESLLVALGVAAPRATPGGCASSIAPALRGCAASRHRFRTAMLCSLRWQPSHRNLYRPSVRSCCHEDS